MELPESRLTFNQVNEYGPKRIGKDRFITATARFDDRCKNGHNTFSLTGETYRKVNGRKVEETGGCIHEAIATHFPELAPYIKWHGCHTDGPLHYVANTLYHVSNKDCWGYRKGEPSKFSPAFYFSDSPISYMTSVEFYNFIISREKRKKIKIVAVPFENQSDYSSHFEDRYTFEGYEVDWYKCPFKLLRDAEEFQQALETCKVRTAMIPTSFGIGKERNLDAARSCAIWPEATDEELLSADLDTKLIARLPGLIQEFKQAMESLGFTY